MDQKAIQFYLEEALGVRSVLRPVSVPMPTRDSSSLRVTTQGSSEPRSHSIEDSPELTDPVRSHAASRVELQVVTESIGSNPKMTLWLLERAGTEERALLDKMMRAGKISSYLLFWGRELKALEPSELVPATQIILKFGGEAESDRRVTVTEPLSSMLSGTSQQIQNSKKKVWTELQNLLKLIP